MLKRLLEIKEPISRATANDDVCDVLSGNEWNVIAGLVKILNPLEEATSLSSGVAYPTTSMIIPLVTGIMSGVNSYLISHEGPYTVSHRFAKELKNSLMARFPESSDLVAKKAMILDPRYKSLMLTQNDSYLVTRELLNEIQSDDRRSPSPVLASTSKGIIKDLIYL